MSPAAENVIDRIDAARQKWWLCSLLSTTVLAICASFGLFVCFMAADAMLLLPSGWLAGLAAAWLAVSLALMILVGRRLLRGQRSIEAAARRIEAEFPQLGSDLINIVQLREEAAGQNLLFREAAVNQAAARLGGLRLDRAADRQSRLRRFVHCMQTPRDLVEALAVLLLLAGVALACRAALPNWGSAASRLFAPWTFVPSVGSVEIVSVTPGDRDVPIGESVGIAAEIRNPGGRPLDAKLFISKRGQPEKSLAMSADRTKSRFALTVPSVIEPFDYRLEIGDTQTRIYSIGVRRIPVVESAEATFRYPAYMERPDETAVLGDLNVEAPQFAEVALLVRPSAPIARGYVERSGEQFLGRVEPDGTLAVSPIPLLQDGTFVVRMWNDAGHTDPNPRANNIRVVIDKPPKVDLSGLNRATKNGATAGLSSSVASETGTGTAGQASSGTRGIGTRQATIAAPGTAIPLAIRAGDDYGLGRIELQVRMKESEKIETVRQWTDFPTAATSAERRHRLLLDAERFEPGQTLLVRAVAWDKRRIDSWGHKLEPQESAGPWHEITLVSKDDEIAAALERLDDLRAELMKILEKQVRARAAVASANAGRAPIADVRGRQIDIQKSAAVLADSIDPAGRKAPLGIKRRLNGLAADEMIEAVRLCDELLNIQNPNGDNSTSANSRGQTVPGEESPNSRPPRNLLASGDFDEQLDELAVVQDRIIDALRDLLNVARREHADLLAEMASRPGGDLPDDAKTKLEELRDKLEKFLEQQRKVIEASEDLAKTPVDDFTEEQEALLKSLAAAEDDLSRFLQEMRSDLSKLPEQDFSNPSMAEELIEIETEIKMAEGALLKKSADIAVPLEQLGYEMAEELKTNLEKWLPDTPDRERWSQEESPTDADKEAPMAELPGELEDLVGELMEEEEDLFDEMEDISSSAADSMDTGAGWDAADGPISNMSAKGVTGNRLPNSSEIGGRSGEGRQGKSSGEFVGDEAVGKGGRRTPSRLTPDPNVAGAIKDRDRQAAGGATGGGKESGQGGEGLEGPVPRSPGQRDLQRLAGRQAELRNKAEGIDLRFQVSGYHRADLKRLIEVMAQVERDLKSGRYKNALRQRDLLLEGLGGVKQYLEGDFQARRDASANLPADVRKELLGGMHDPSPDGWEELNRRYYERLSKGDGGRMNEE